MAMTTYQQMAFDKAVIMQAFAAGSYVQYRPRYMHHAIWQRTDNPSWRWDEFEYRISPHTDND